MRVTAEFASRSCGGRDRVAKKTSRAEQKARRPEEILEAAFEEFSAKGYAATRVEDVATRVGITKGTVYLYFPTKHVLFEEMYRHASKASANPSSAVRDLRGSCADRIRALLHIAYEEMASNRKTMELLRLSVAEAVRFPEMVDCRDELFIAPTLAALTALVAEGVKSGELRHDSSHHTPDVLAGLVFHVAVWRLMFDDRKPIDSKALLERHIDLVMSGLLRRPKQTV